METIYIKKGRVFSGYDEPSRIANILVEGGKVARISEEPILGNPRPPCCRCSVRSLDRWPF